jgi:PmbA protein
MMNMLDIQERSEKALTLSQILSDKAEIFTATNDLLSIRIANNKIIESKAIADTGIGIRLIKGDGLGFSSTTDLTDEGLQKTIDDAATMAKYRKTGFKYDFPYPKKAKPADIFDKPTANLLTDLDKVTEQAHTMMDASMDTSKKILENSGIINILRINKQILSTNGIDVSEKSTGWSAFLTSTAQEGQEQREGMVTGSTIKVEDFDPAKIGRESAEMAVKSLGGGKIAEKDYKLILLPSAAQCLVTELSGCTNPSTMESSIPLLQDRLGEQVGSDKLTVRINPRRSGFAMAGVYDDEGVPTQELTLFDKGVFMASPYDSWYSQKEEVEGTGHGFRSMSMSSGGTVYHGKMYHSEPAARAACLEMEDGDESVDEMIESTKNGIIVGVVWYSRIMLPTRGDYMAIMRMGTMKVENGEIIGAVQKFRLVDNILDLAKNIEMVGKTEALSHWHMPYGRMAPIKVSKGRCMPYHD